MECRNVKGDRLDVQFVGVHAVANLVDIPDADILRTLLSTLTLHQFLDPRMHVVGGMDRDCGSP
jgi:hypothetical protein